MAFIAGGSDSTISSTVTNKVVAASAASRCAPTMPSMSTLPARSARCACNTVTSGLSAGTAASRSPVNGHSTSRMREFCARQIGSDVAAQHAERQARCARAIGSGHAGVAVFVELDRAAANDSRPHRATGAVNRRQDCRPRKMSAFARSPCRSSGRRSGRGSFGSGAGRGDPGGSSRARRQMESGA